jgi:hypothetical protein
MKIIPRNKQLRGVLLGCAALSAVMAGPILVDSNAQALPQAAACTSGGVCLTSSEANATATSTTTETLTGTVPPTATVTETGAPVTSTATVTQTVTTGSTSTTTVTVTSTPTFSRTTFTPFTNAGDPAVRADLVTTGSSTTGSSTTGSSITGSACGMPGTTTSLGGGEVETCGPSFGHVAVFATQPGLYNTIDNTTSSYYVSVGIFAPQFRFGYPDGCYYVPDPSSVAGPGQTVTSSDGVLTNAVAFGLYSQEVSHPIQVPRFDCGAGNAATGAGQQGSGQPGLKQ